MVVMRIQLLAVLVCGILHAHPGHEIHNADEYRALTFDSRNHRHHVHCRESFPERLYSMEKALSGLSFTPDPSRAHVIYQKVREMIQEMQYMLTCFQSNYGAQSIACHDMLLACKDDLKRLLLRGQHVKRMLQTKMRMLVAPESNGIFEYNRFLQRKNTFEETIKILALSDALLGGAIAILDRTVPTSF